MVQIQNKLYVFVDLDKIFLLSLIQMLYWWIFSATGKQKGDKVIGYPVFCA